MEEKRAEIKIFSDGRPITCPTLRGIRMGLYECSKRGAVCCWSCDKFSQGSNYYYCGYWSKVVGLFKSSRGWNFRVPKSSCDNCPHYPKKK